MVLVFSRHHEYLNEYKVVFKYIYNSLELKWGIWEGVIKWQVNLLFGGRENQILDQHIVYD